MEHTFYKYSEVEYFISIFSIINTMKGFGKKHKRGYFFIRIIYLSTYYIINKR